MIVIVEIEIIIDYCQCQLSAEAIEPTLNKPAAIAPAVTEPTAIVVQQESGLHYRIYTNLGLAPSGLAHCPILMHKYLKRKGLLELT